jgi:hypothetical protein
MRRPQLLQKGVCGSFVKLERQRSDWSAAEPSRFRHPQERRCDATHQPCAPRLGRHSTRWPRAPRGQSGRRPQVRPLSSNAGTQNIVPHRAWPTETSGRGLDRLVWERTMKRLRVSTRVLGAILLALFARMIAFGPTPCDRTDDGDHRHHRRRLSASHVPGKATRATLNPPG